MTAVEQWGAVVPGSIEAREAVLLNALAEKGIKHVTTSRRLAAAPPPPTRFVVPGVLPHGLALLYGMPKQGKSWLALELALAVSRGGLVAGHFRAEQGAVLYLALEDGQSRLYERQEALLCDEDAPDNLTFITRLEGSLDDLVRTWHQHSQEPRLVILDTIGKARRAAPSNGNAYAEDYAAMGVLKHLADDLDICLVGVHHSRKSAGGDGDVEAASGTFGIVGAADTGWHLRPAVEGVSALGVWSRDAEGGEWPMRRVGPAWQVTDGPIPDANLGDRSNQVKALVVQRGEDGTRAADVATALGISEDGARQALKRLADDPSKHGVTKRGRGLYVPVTSVTSVTKDTDDLDSPVTVVTDVTPPQGDLLDGWTT